MPAASASRSSVVGSVAALVVLAVLVGGGLVYLLDRQRAAEAEAVAQVDAEIAARRAAAQREKALQAQIEREKTEAARIAEAESAVVEAENQRLKLELVQAEQKRQATAAAAEQAARAAEAYRKGLGSAVEELNRQRVRSSVDHEAVKPRPATAYVRAYYGPFVYIIGDDVRAWGHVKNYGDSRTSVRIRIALYRDNRLVDEKAATASLEKDEDYRYDVDFSSWHGSDYDFKARVIVE